MEVETTAMRIMLNVSFFPGDNGFFLKILSSAGLMDTLPNHSDDPIRNE